MGFSAIPFYDDFASHIPNPIYTLSHFPYRMGLHCTSPLGWCFIPNGLINFVQGIFPLSRDISSIQNGSIHRGQNAEIFYSVVSIETRLTKTRLVSLNMHLQDTYWYIKLCKETRYNKITFTMFGRLVSIYIRDYSH